MYIFKDKYIFYIVRLFPEKQTKFITPLATGLYCLITTFALALSKEKNVAILEAKVLFYGLNLHVLSCLNSSPIRDKTNICHQCFHLNIYKIFFYI